MNQSGSEHVNQSELTALPAEESRRFRTPSWIWSGLFLAADGTAYLAGVAGTVWFEGWGLRLASAAVAGFAAALLFTVAHDACHQSLTPSPRLNRWLGTMCFLPSLHNYSLWRHGHNFLHHLHTNRRGYDYVWEPVSFAEYSNMGWFRKMRYRFFRSFAGHAFYTPFEVWFPRRFFPRASHVGIVKAEHWVDFSLVVGWATLMTCGLSILRSVVTESSLSNPALWAQSAFLGVFIPFFISGMLNSLTTFLHHTHPDVHWTTEKPGNGWDAHQTAISVHVRFPTLIDWSMHWIMDHTAHHLRPRIPLYRLQEAQETIEEHHREQMIIWDFNMKFVLEILRVCKLYDSERGCWTDYRNNPTSVPRNAVTDDPTNQTPEQAA